MLDGGNVSTFAKVHSSGTLPVIQTLWRRASPCRISSCNLFQSSRVSLRTFHLKRDSSKCSMQPYVTLVFQVYHLSRSDTRTATNAASGKVFGHLPHSHARTTRSRYTDQYQEERQLLDVLSQCFIWPCI